MSQFSLNQHQLLSQFIDDIEPTSVPEPILIEPTSAPEPILIDDIEPTSAPELLLIDDDEQTQSESDDNEEKTAIFSLKKSKVNHKNHEVIIIDLLFLTLRVF